MRGHLLEQQRLPANVKVPLITPHDPRLPMGPPAMMGFPQPMPYPPMTPQNVGGQHIPIGAMPGIIAPPEGLMKRSNSMEGAAAAAANHEEQIQQQQIALWQQQQQQQLALHLSQMQVPPHQIPVQTPGFVAAIPQAPHSSHAPQLPEQPTQHKAASQGAAFTFPSAEEVSNRRWVEHLAMRGGLVPPGIYPAAAAAAVHPQQMLETLYAQQPAPPPPPPPSTGGVAGARQLTAEDLLQAGAQGPARIILPPELIAAGYPPEALAVSMDQLIAQQQQQQQMAVLAGRSDAHATQQQQQQQLMELEAVAQQVHKDPSLLQNLQVQMMMQQREQLIQHQNHLRLQDMLMQQELLQKQQQQQHQQFVLGRPPTGHDDPASARSRPGVIVNQTK